MYQFQRRVEALARPAPGAILRGVGRIALLNGDSLPGRGLLDAEPEF